MAEQVSQPVATDKPKIVGWARVYTALQPSFSKALRRGAWYAVVRNDQPDRVSIRMGSRSVDVPRRLVEVRGDRPKYFSVVNRVGYHHEQRRQSLHNLGKLYAVCPVCSDRFALWGHPEKTQCPGCRHEGEVAWWEA